MSVFRRRQIFRDSSFVRLFGGATIITATCTAAVAFGATATGSTPGLTGEVAAPVVVSFGPISEGTIEVSVPLAVSFTTTATGLQLTPVTVNTPVVFGVTARTDVNVTAAVVWNSTATVGTTFTMDVAAPVVWSATPASQVGSVVAANTVVGFSTGIPDITDGTISTATTAAVSWACAGTGSFGVTNNVPNPFFFDTVFNAELSTEYESSLVTIDGITIATLATISDGDMSINGDVYSDDSAMVENGDTIQARHISSDEYSASTVTTVIVGGVAGTFTTITRARPTPPAGRRNQLMSSKRRRFS